MQEIQPKTSLKKSYELEREELQVQAMKSPMADPLKIHTSTTVNGSTDKHTQPVDHLQTINTYV